VAPRRVQIVLALEVEAPCWPTNCTAGDTQAYPRDEHCQPAVGSAAVGVMFPSNITELF
jgi:hypothetical protein